MLQIQPYKPVFLTLILLSVWVGLFGQVWNKTYIEDRPIMLFSSVYTDSNNYKVIGLAADKFPPYRARALAATIDPAGLMVKYLVETDSSNKSFGVFLNSLIKTIKGDYAFAGYVLDTVPMALFAVFDKNLDSMRLFTYNDIDPFAYTGYVLTQIDANSFYVAGVYTKNGTFNSNLVLLKIDSNGNRIWQKYYDQFKSDNVRSILSLKNGNILLGAHRSDLNQTVEHANTWLLEVDTEGIVVRQWFDPNDSTYTANGLFQTPDGGFIYCAQKKDNQTINSVYKIATIVKLDSSFTKQWMFSGGFPGTETGFYDIAQDVDGSFLACGKSNYRNGWIIKLSSNGDSIWSREYVGIQAMGSESYLTDIDALDDGSIIAVGYCNHVGQQPPQVGWFLKLDSNGCEIENCLVGVSDPKNNGDRIKVYPNPSTSKIFVNLNVELIGATVSLYDGMGKKIREQIANDSEFSIETNDLEDGLYVLVARKGLLQFIDKVLVE